MLNNSNIIRLGSNSQTVNFNAPCTGILQRSHSKSKFIQFAKGSEVSQKFFPTDGSNPYIITASRNTYNPKKEEITILQMMLFGNERFLVEYVFNTDLIIEIIS